MNLLVKTQLERVITHVCVHVFCFVFANQWLSQDILSLSTQSECTKMDIHWFGIY